MPAEREEKTPLHLDRVTVENTIHADVGFLGVTRKVKKEYVKKKLRKFEDYSFDLLNSDYSTFPDRLKFLMNYLSKDFPNTVAKFRSNRNIDVNEWYATFKKSAGSMIGSARLEFPFNEEDRTALLYQILEKISKGEIDFTEFCSLAFPVTNLDLMVFRFNSSVTNPFIKSIRRELEEISELEILTADSQIEQMPKSKEFDKGITYFLDISAITNWNKDLRQRIEKLLQTETLPLNQRIDNAMMTMTKLVENRLKEALQNAECVPSGENIDDLTGSRLVDQAKNWGFISMRKGNEPNPFFYLLKWYFGDPRNTAHHRFDAFPAEELITFLSITNYILNEIDSIEKIT